MIAAAMARYLHYVAMVPGISAARGKGFVKPAPNRDAQQEAGRVGKLAVSVQVPPFKDVPQFESKRLGSLAEFVANAEQKMVLRG